MRKLRHEKKFDLLEQGVLKYAFCCDEPAAPPAPNLSFTNTGVKQSSETAVNAGNQDLAFRQGVYNDSLPRQQELYSMASQVAGQQLGLGNTAAGQIQNFMGDYNSAYRPTALTSAADAFGGQYLNSADAKTLNSLLTGGGPANLTNADRLDQLRGLSQKAENTAGNAAANQAAGQVNRTFGQQARALGRMGGGDPSRMAMLASQLGNQQTLAKVAASNSARSDVRNQIAGLRTGVSNYGLNMPNLANQAAGTAANAGNAAVSNLNTGYMSGLPYAQFQTGAYGTQLGAAGLQQQGALGLGNLQSQLYGTGANLAGQQAEGEGAKQGALISAAVVAAIMI